MTCKATRCDRPLASHAVKEHELELQGGRQTKGVIRVGDTVRRPLHENSAYVHELLRHLEIVGFEGAPRFRGLDDVGREILTFIEGEVILGHDESSASLPLLSDAQLTSAAGLIRQFHDATAGTPLAGSAEVVCHSDLGQHNIVFRGDYAVAIIDWDEDTGPGTRLFDFAHAVWCLAEIGEHGGELSEQARRVRLLCDAYGWDDRSAVIDEIEGRFKRALAWNEERGHTVGVSIFAGLLEWILAHGAQLKADTAG